MAGAAAFFAAAACAQGDAVPLSPFEARTHELHQVINDPKSTAAERQGAREELANLLKSPAGQAPGPTPDRKPAAPRAAVEPLAPMVRPAANPPISSPPVAHVDVTQPPRTTVTPTGKAVAPTSNGSAIDPRNGHVLTETPNGYVDPRTGQFTPK